MMKSLNKNKSRATLTVLLVFVLHTFATAQSVNFTYSPNRNIVKKEIDIDPKEYDINGDSVVCIGNTAEFRISTNDPASWSNGANGVTATYTITQDTVIRAVVTNQYGCEFEQEKIVEVADLPAVPVIVRSGDSLIVSNVSGHFEWYRNGLLFSVGLNFIRPSLEGDYTVKVRNAQGCENESEVFTFIIYYSISTSSNPSNGGTTSGGGDFSSGSAVTLSATTNTGWNFVNWTENGNVVSSDSSYSFVASSNRNLVANFNQVIFSITTSSNPSNGGTTSGGGTYVVGSQLTVLATPNTGWNFVNWTENGNVVSSNSSYSFVVSSNRNLVANFNQATYSIITSSNPTNGGTTSGGGTFVFDTQITVLATPNTGWNFVNWTENGNVVSSNPSFTFSVTGDKAIVANFSQQIFAITTSSSPASGGTTSGGGSFLFGTQITVTASPNVGWRFVNWREGNVVLSTDPSFVITVGANRNLVAHFEQAIHSINLSTNPTNVGTVTGSGNYIYGLTATVLATSSDPVWRFLHWSEGGTIVSTNAHYEFTVLADRFLIASFTIVNSVDEVDIERDLEIFPNPSSGNFTISAKDGIVIKEAEIYDILGRRLLAVAFNNTPYLINGSGLPKGNYLVKVKTKDGVVVVKKLVIV